MKAFAMYLFRTNTGKTNILPLKISNIKLNSVLHFTPFHWGKMGKQKSFFGNTLLKFNKLVSTDAILDQHCSDPYLQNIIIIYWFAAIKNIKSRLIYP